MSHQSDINPSAEPSAPPQEDFKKFADKVNTLLEKYAVTDFYIRCCLTSSCVYLNDNYKEEDFAVDPEEYYDTSMHNTITRDQQNTPFVQELFALFAKHHPSSFVIYAWIPISENIESHMKVVGDQNFDYADHVSL